jgi:sulfatase modifying factor 1
MPAPSAIQEALRLVVIPAGWFTMGCDTGRDDERPTHRVWVDSFLLAAGQVRNLEYAEFLRATGAPPPPCWSDPHFNDPDQPVVAVSWFEAEAYCRWLSTTAGRPFRLPTEAEWERAARGGIEGKLYPWGDEPPQSRPDYASRWENGPEPVASQSANAFGLFDIGENVHEWCADWYDAHCYANSPARNPTGPAHGQRRASRGGSWRHHIKISRCAARSSIPPNFQYVDYGFRIASSLDPGVRAG